MKNKGKRKLRSLCWYIICVTVFLFIIHKGIVVFLDYPIYPAFMKEYKTQKELVGSITQLEWDLYYPDQIVEEWSERSYWGVLDGRQYDSETYGYQVSGCIESEGIIYELVIRGEIKEEVSHYYQRKSIYRDIEYGIHENNVSRTGYLDYGEQWYEIHVCYGGGGRNDITQEVLQTTEDILVEVMEAFIDGLLSQKSEK